MEFSHQGIYGGLLATFLKKTLDLVVEATWIPLSILYIGSNRQERHRNTTDISVKKSFASLCASLIIQAMTLACAAPSNAISF